MAWRRAGRGRGGNLTSKTGVGNYTYGAAQAADCPEGALVKANTVVQGGNNPQVFYCYDQNGNLRRRKVGTSTTTTFSYDAENRLTSVSGAATAAFVYDGDGNRVKATFGATTTVYVGAIYEMSGSTVRKYYYAGGSRVAMRSGVETYYLLGDHLGGTNVTARGIDGGELGRVLYRPWGETRVSTGTTPTTWRLCVAPRSGYRSAERCFNWAVLLQRTVP